MAWRDELRVASFRGAQFKVDSSSLGAGRRLARHEYPQRDLPYLEDMGRKAREYTVEAFVVGQDYMLQRDELLAAIEESGPGQLIHPYHGTLMVTAADCSLTESNAYGGMARFAITFVEAGKPEEPGAIEDTEAGLDAQYDLSEAAIAEDFAESFSIDGLPDFVTGDALSSLESMLDLPSLDLGELSWIRADPLSSLQSLLPESLLSSLSAPLDLARGVLSLVRRATGDVADLFGFSLPAVASGIYTPSRIAQNNNRAALSGLLLQAATTRRISDLARSQPPTYSDALLARNEIVTRADAVLFSEATGARAADSVLQLRTQAVAHLQRILPSLPRSVHIVPNVSRPAVVEAHDFYGDDWFGQGRDAEIVARNALRHPGAVPAGRVLELIA